MICLRIIVLRRALTSFCIVSGYVPFHSLYAMFFSFVVVSTDCSFAFGDDISTIQALLVSGSVRSQHGPASPVQGLFPEKEIFRFPEYRLSGKPGISASPFLG